MILYRNDFELMILNDITFDRNDKKWSHQLSWFNILIIYSQISFSSDLNPINYLDLYIYI